MKINWLFFGLVISSIFFVEINSYSQIFLAGQHNVNNYFYDINPDTTLIRKDEGYKPPSEQAIIYPIDINGDGINDLFLYSSGFWVNGMGKSNTSINSFNRNTCQIAFGHYDTCHTFNPGYSLYKMAKSLKKDEPIDGNLIWRNDSSLNLNYTDWNATGYTCLYNGFINDSLGNYLGIRLIKPQDTTYGWIKVTNIDFLTFTVQEFAFIKHPTNVTEHSNRLAIYPIPTKGNVTIETQLSDLWLIVYNQNGIEIFKQKLDQGKNLINLGEYASGVYLFQLLGNNSMFIKKIIKQ